MMRPVQARKLLEEGKTVINGWCVIPGGFLAELMGALGWDALTIDVQHGLIDRASMLSMLQAISISSATPMVRLSANDPAQIGHALDAGAMGVICPLVNSAEEAGRFVDACRYPPHGSRSSGPTRAVVYAGLAYLNEADDQILKFAMIETRAGLDNLDAIIATPGLDGVYIGPSDLSLALGGTHGYDKADDKMVAAYETVVAACRRHGKYAGVHTATPEFAARMAGMGFNLVTIVGDMNFILAGMGTVAKARQLISNAPTD